MSTPYRINGSHGRIERAGAGAADSDRGGLVVLVVDDEEPGISTTRDMLNSNPRVGKVLTAFDAAEALRKLRQDNPELAGRPSDAPLVDAVFIDVAMPGLTGMDLARVLFSFENAPALVFITAHGENALEAFDLGAIDYVMKPASPERVERALRKVQRITMPLEGTTGEQAALNQGSGNAAIGSGGQDDHSVIPVELGGTTRLVQRSQVRWVEAQGDYARLHTDEGSHLVRIPLAQLEEKWADAGFVRIHRSYLVSLNLINELRMSSSGYSVLIAGGQYRETRELPVSRRHTRELKDRLVRSPRQRRE
ncbi:two component transcriptional regulator, LytTR family [Actinopolyspora xinjiangensis]|uniref:Two component transcriptional regulator, LytTR family n=1 Tax=Actinopolyspora xinjiangensis TaxID=405564 RepID=A0A1H0WZD0_9ACTN|nr:LytTR family DNA-binding domain-containing protein [Actinopolyspora xinjiangensis]SDP96053.1 two component transcriptional regulator, LytTR family [Actinopolyspora xinjiangensis]